MRKIRFSNRFGDVNFHYTHKFVAMVVLFRIYVITTGSTCEKQQDKGNMSAISRCYSYCICPDLVANYLHKVQTLG